MKQNKAELEKQLEHIEQHIVKVKDEIDEMNIQWRDKQRQMDKLYKIRDRIEEEIAELEELEELEEPDDDFETYMLKQLLHSIIDTFI